MPRHTFCYPEHLACQKIQHPSTPAPQHQADGRNRPHPHQGFCKIRGGRAATTRTELGDLSVTPKCQTHRAESAFGAVWPAGRSGGCSPSVRVHGSDFITCQGGRPAPVTDIGRCVNSSFRPRRWTAASCSEQLLRRAQDHCGSELARGRRTLPVAGLGHMPLGRESQRSSRARLR